MESLEYLDNLKELFSVLKENPDIRITTYKKCSRILAESGLDAFKCSEMLCNMFDIDDKTKALQDIVNNRKNMLKL